MITENDIPNAFEKTIAGDNEAFHTDVEAFRLPMTRYVQSIVRDFEISRELAQDTFVQAIEKARSFRGDASGETYRFRDRPFQNRILRSTNTEVYSCIPFHKSFR